MRRAFNDVAFLTLEDGTTAGICLGFDFCAEHEFGVKRIKQAMGIPGTMGVEGRTMTQQPAIVHFEKFKRTQRRERGAKTATRETTAALIVSAQSWLAPKKEEPIKQTLRSIVRDGLDFYYDPHEKGFCEERDNLISAWDETGFAVVARGADNIKHLEEIHKALLANDIALADPSGMGFAGRNGLGVVIASRVPEDIRKKVRDSDEDHARLLRAAEDTGIAQKIKKSGKGFFALEPAWANEDKTEVKFFLNPTEQRQYNSGWFTLAQLEAWTRDEGPILKANDTPKPRKPGP